MFMYLSIYIRDRVSLCNRSDYDGTHFAKHVELNLQSSTSFCPLCARIKGMRCYHSAKHFYLEFWKRYSYGSWWLYIVRFALMISVSWISHCLHSTGHTVSCPDHDSLVNFIFWSSNQFPHPMCSSCVFS